MKKMRLAASFTSLFLGFGVSLYAAHVDVRLTGGGVMPRLKNTPTVWVASNLVNEYQAQKRTSTGLMWGGGVDIGSDRLTNLPLDFNVGVSGYSVDFRHISGVKQWFVNQGTFDSSLYSFANKSSVGLVEGRLYYTGSDWQPFILAGLGLASNKSSFYREIALGAMVANQNFSNGKHHAFAYDAGFGLRRELFKDKAGIQYAMSLDYRYINVGSSHLGPFDGQASTSRLHVGHLQSDALLLTLSARA